MATRSTISKVYPDGTVKSVYCHWDGYISNNGVLLQEHYQDEAKIDALLALGSISSLGSKVGVKHDFNERDSEDTTAYHRDRGDELCVRKEKCYDNLLKNTSRHKEFNYVRRNGEWFVFEDPQSVVRLSDAIEGDPVVPVDVKERVKRLLLKVVEETAPVATKTKKTANKVARKPAKRIKNSVVLIGREWFDKVNGNSYSTTEIIVDGESVHRTLLDGCYGSAYIDNGVRWLENNNYFKRLDHESRSALQERLGFKLHCVLIPVARKKETDQ